MSRDKSYKNDSDEKLDVDKDVFYLNEQLKKKSEEDTKQKLQEIECQKAQLEKERREAYEKKLHDEKMELMRLKQGLVDEADTSIMEEEIKGETKMTFGKKVSNFFYHNKWWLGLGTAFAAILIFVVVDFILTPRPDMTILMLCSNDAASSKELDPFFTEFYEDIHGEKDTLVSVSCTPYSDDDYYNSTNGLQQKVLAQLSSTDYVMIIGNHTTIDSNFVSAETLVDLSSIYPDDPHVKGCFYYIKDTDLAERLDISPDALTEDMFFALRDPSALSGNNKDSVQEVYDKDFPVFDSVIKSLSGKQ